MWSLHSTNSMNSNKRIVTSVALILVVCLLSAPTPTMASVATRSHRHAHERTRGMPSRRRLQEKSGEKSGEKSAKSESKKSSKSSKKCKSESASEDGNGERLLQDTPDDGGDADPEECDEDGDGPSSRLELMDGDNMSSASVVSESSGYAATTSIAFTTIAIAALSGLFVTFQN